MVSKNLPPNPRSGRFLPVFFSRRFRVLGLNVFSPFYCMWKSGFPSTVCRRDGSFPVAWSWHPCGLSPDHLRESLSLGSQFCSSVYHTLDYSSSAVSSEIAKCEFSKLVFFSKIVLAVWGSFEIPYEFYDGFFCIKKKAVGIFLVMTLNLYTALCSVVILRILSQYVNMGCLTVYVS